MQAHIKDDSYYSLINQGPTLSNMDDSRENLSGDENLVEKMQGRSKANSYDRCFKVLNDIYIQKWRNLCEIHPIGNQNQCTNVLSILFTSIVNKIFKP